MPSPKELQVDLEKDVMDFLDDEGSGDVVDPPEDSVDPVETVTDPVEPVVDPVEDPKVDEPVVDPVTDPVVEPVVDPAVETVKPVVAAEPVVDPVIPKKSELEQLKEQNAALIDQINAVATPAPAQPAEPAEPVELPTDVAVLMEAMDFDNVTGSKEEFVKFLGQFAEVINNKAIQQSMTSIPGVVGKFVSRQTALKDVKAEFYKVHPELESVKGYVAQVANTVHAENPEMKIGEILEEAAKRTKVALKLTATVEKGEKDAARQTPVVDPPALPGANSSSPTRGKKAPSKGLQNEIDEFLTD